MRDIYWKGITHDIEDFVKSCQTCRRAKSVQQAPYGYLKTLPIPERKWTHISMDHIDQLPMSNGDGHKQITPFFFAILSISWLGPITS
jgi:hypothetical protein